jgi:hypothetical protein
MNNPGFSPPADGGMQQVPCPFGLAEMLPLDNGICRSVASS